MELRQVAIPVGDLNRAISFYTKLLGIAPQAIFAGANLAFFPLGKTRLLLDGNIKVFHPSGFIYLEVEDVRETINECEGQGIEITSKPHIVFQDHQGTFDAPGNEWLAFIKDSEGNQVGLMSREKTRE